MRKLGAGAELRKKKKLELKNLPLRHRSIYLKLIYLYICILRNIISDI